MLSKLVQFNLTDIGEGIFEVEVLQWYIKEGDKIQAFDKICEVASDKATVEIPSRFGGTVTKLHHKVGQMAKVGAPLIDLEDGTPSNGADSSPAPAGSPPSPAVPATPPTSTPIAQAPPVAAPAAPAQAPTHPSGLAPGKVLATPAVRAIAQEHGVDLTLVPATGSHGHIVKEDILQYLKQHSSPAPGALSAAPVSAPTSSGVAAAVPAPAAQPVVTAGDRVEPLTGMRRAMFKSMTQSLTIPMFSCGDTLEMDALIALRDRCRSLLQARAKASGAAPPALSFLPFIMKACSLGLKQYPILNASVNAETQEVVYRAGHNIGIAMDTSAGLVVPNVKDVQVKSIVQIAEELTHLQDLARANKLSPQHLQDGTFTLSNIGAIGATWAIPVVFPPQVAIGAISKMEKLPRFDENGNVVARHVMHFGWSADHRVVEGATMVRFSNALIAHLQDPESMIMDL